MFLAVPYESPDSSIDAIAAAVRIALTSALGVVTLVCISMLAVVIARRLCGSKMIFAENLPQRPLTPEQIPARWYALDRADKVFLYELTHDQIVNPANAAALERLVAEGFVRFNPWPQIADAHVRKHIESVDLTVDLRHAEQNREAGSWRWLRAPLLIGLVAVLGLFAWFAGSSMQIATTVFAGIATLLGYLGKAQAFIRGEK